MPDITVQFEFGSDGMGKSAVDLINEQINEIQNGILDKPLKLKLDIDPASMDSIEDSISKLAERVGAKIGDAVSLTGTGAGMSSRVLGDIRRQADQVAKAANASLEKVFMSGKIDLSGQTTNFDRITDGLVSNLGIAKKEAEEIVKSISDLSLPIDSFSAKFVEGAGGAKDVLRVVVNSSDEVGRSLRQTIDFVKQLNDAGETVFEQHVTGDFSANFKKADDAARKEEEAYQKQSLDMWKAYEAEKAAASAQAQKEIDAGIRQHQREEAEQERLAAESAKIAAKNYQDAEDERLRLQAASAKERQKAEQRTQQELEASWKAYEAEKAAASKKELETSRGLDEHIAKEQELEQAIARRTKAEIEAYDKSLAQEQKQADAAERAKSKQLESILNTQTQISSLKQQYSTDDFAKPYITSLNELSDRLSQMKAEINNMGDSFNMESSKDFSAELSTITTRISSLKTALGSLNDVAKDNFLTNPKAQAEAEQKLTKKISEVQKYLKNYSSAKNSGNDAAETAYGGIKKAGEQYLDLLNKVKDGKITVGDLGKELARVDASLADHVKTVDETGFAHKSLGDTIKTTIQKYGQYFAVSRLFAASVRTMKQMVQQTIAVDDAMTQLQIVTKSSNKDMAAYSKTAFDSAKRLGTSVTDVISATTTYARLGYTMKESGTLAELTTMLQGVGDIDASSAQSAITAIVKAFDGIDVNNISTVMDKLVAVGNGAPISVSELAEGLNNAGSALSAAGNSFDESVALLTSANAVVQDASKSSTGLRTIAARIRNTKTELDELGETVTAAEYQGIVDALTDITLADGTKARVSLTDVNGELRSTYDIIKDIAGVWQYMGANEQAALAETLAGTRQQNVFYSLVENFDEATNAMDLMSESTGAMQEAYDTFLESTSAHIEQFKAAFAELSVDLIDTGILNGFIDAGRIVIETIDKIVSIAQKGGLVGEAGLAAGILGVVKSITSVSSAVKGLDKDWAKTASRSEKFWKVLGDAFPRVSGLFTGFVSDLKNGATFAEAFSASIGKIGSGLATFATSFTGQVTIAIAAVTAIVGLIDLLTTSQEEANESMQAAASKYTESKDNLTAINNEIAITRQRITELEQLGPLTFVEQSELENLREANRLLLIQQDLAKKNSESSARETARTTLAAYRNNYRYAISAAETERDMQGLDIWEESSHGTNISLNLAKIRYLRQEIENLDTSTVSGMATFNAYQGMIEGTTDFVWEQATVLEGYRRTLESVPENLRTREQTEAIAQIGEQIKYIYTELDPAAWKQIEYEGLFDNVELRAAKANMIAIAKEAGNVAVTAETLRDTIPDIDDRLANTTLSIEEVATAINAEAGLGKRFVGDDAPMYDSVENAKEQRKRVSDYIDYLTDMGDQYDRYIDAIQYYQDTMSEASDKALDYYQAGVSRFGNIDLDNRQRMVWTDALAKQFENELNSWGATAEEMVGSISTVFGASGHYSDKWGFGTEIAFSPILQTEDGPKLLSQETVDRYIGAVIDEAGSIGADYYGTWADRALEIDSRGIEIDGVHISNLIARIGEDANEVGELMHFLGNDGALQQSYLMIAQAAGEAGMATDEFISMLPEFEGAYDFINSELIAAQTQLAALDQYIHGQSARDMQTALKNLWNSEGFEDTKNEVTELAKTMDGITPDAVVEVAAKSEALAAILSQTGMTAKFLANVLQHEVIKEGSGFEMVTAGALALNAALHETDHLYAQIAAARKKYSDAMSAGEVDDNFKSVAQAYSALQGEIDAGRQGNAFWASAEYVFGASQLEEWGYSIEKITAAMAGAKDILGDADSGGFGFLDKLYEMSQSGKVKGDDGSILAEISKLADGSYDFKVNMEQLDALSSKLGVSKEAILASMEALSLWGDVAYYDVDNVMSTMKEIGLASDAFNGTAVNASHLTEQLTNLGYHGKELYDLKQSIAALDGVTLIDINGSVDDLVSGLTSLGIATNNGDGISIDADKFGQMAQSLSLSKQEATQLFNQLKSIEGVQFIQDGQVVDEITFDDAEKTIDVLVELDDSAVSDFMAKSFDKSANLTYTVVVNGNIPEHAKGTKNAPGGPSLVGEEGEELIQSGNKAYFVGSNGPEIVNLRKGDIVYTAAETRAIKGGRLFASGVIPSHRYANYVDPSLDHLPAPRKSPTTTTNNGGTVNRPQTTPNNNNVGGVGGGSNSSNDDKLEKVDWIERAVKKLEREIDKLGKVANSAFKTLTDKMSAAGDEITKVTSEIALQQKAYDRYIQEAESVALDSGIKQFVRDGTIDIQSYSEETRKLISEYQKWYDKATDTADAVDNLHESIAKLYQDRFNNINEDFDNQLSLLEHQENQYNASLDAMEAVGYRQSAVYYEKLSGLTRSNIGIMQNQVTALEKSLNEALASGEIKEYSNAWYDMKNAILDVRDNIDDANASLIQYGNTIREIQWGYFDLARSKMDDINSEAEFLINLMSNSDFFDDNGRMSGAGTATMGLMAQNYNVDMQQAESYAKEILRLDKAIANDPYNTVLIDRRKELVEAQRESILAAQQEKESIRDLIRDGFDAQLNSLKNLIDEYNDALDSAKDLYDYTNKINDSTSNISNLQKQIAAYSGDTSEAATMRVQKLQNDLNKAQKDLQDQEYNRYISEQKKLLDDMYSDYEETLNNRLDNIDSLIADAIDAVNANKDEIRKTLIDVANSVGYTISDDANNIWSDNSLASGVVSAYDQDFNYKLTTITQVLSNIEKYVADAQQNSSMIAATGIRAYARGGLVDFTGLAKLDGSVTNPEIVLNPQDSANFISLRDMMRRMSGTDISALSSGSILSDISATAGMYSMMNAIRGAGQGAAGYRDIQINIPIDHVSDYNDFVSQLRDDPQFESMMLDMTVNKLSGGSNIAKNRYKW